MAMAYDAFKNDIEANRTYIETAAGQNNLNSLVVKAAMSFAALKYGNNNGTYSVKEQRAHAAEISDFVGQYLMQDKIIVGGQDVANPLFKAPVKAAYDAAGTLAEKADVLFQNYHLNLDAVKQAALNSDLTDVNDFLRAVSQVTQLYQMRLSSLLSPVVKEAEKDNWVKYLEDKYTVTVGPEAQTWSVVSDLASSDLIGTLKPSDIVETPGITKRNP